MRLGGGAVIEKVKSKWPTYEEGEAIAGITNRQENDHSIARTKNYGEQHILVELQLGALPAAWQ